MGREDIGRARWVRGKESTCNAGDVKDSDLIPGLGRFPGGGYSTPLQYSCLVFFHGQRSLASYRPWGRKELDKTEMLSMHTEMILLELSFKVSFPLFFFIEVHVTQISPFLRFFFFWWTIFKVLIEFVIILLLNDLGFWLRGMGVLASQPGSNLHPMLEGKVLTIGLPGKSHKLAFLCVCFLFSWPLQVTCGILASQPGIEPITAAVEA